MNDLRHSWLAIARRGRGRPRLLVTCGLACALLMALGVSAAPAREGAFPGRNGKIALEELKIVGDAYYAHVATLTPTAPAIASTDLGSSSAGPAGHRTVNGLSSAAHPRRFRVDQIVNANGSGLKDVVGRSIQNRTELSVGSPDWLPDGRIAFFGYNVGNKGPRARDLHDQAGRTLMRKVVPLADVPVERGGPTLARLRASPDGRRFAFTRHHGGGRADLYSVKANGSNMRRLAQGCWTHGLSLDWSPNSRRLLAGWTGPRGLRYRLLRFGHLHTLADRRDAQANLHRNVRAGSPGQGGVGGCAPQAAFSPDGRTVVFAVHRDPNRRETLCNELRVMSATGGGSRVIRKAPANAGYHAPALQPLRR